MKIGIDIDDTLVYTSKYMIKYAEIYNNEVLKKNKIHGNMGLIRNTHYLQKLYDWTKEEKIDFFKKYYVQVLAECELLPGAKETINYWKSKGHKIYFISARLNWSETCNVDEITKDLLLKSEIEYDEIILKMEDKLEVCLEKEIDVFIDDSYETCIKLKENNIMPYLITSKLNSLIKTEGITRINNWDELKKLIR
ncbi:MAG: HAD hydrolase-like protein [Lachnospiraceae bacterium]|jgi:uncharacterized HAD superfamily protein|nr:HAD hydrolase-like protein [Lachnospiraceae bacterium]